MSVSRASSWRQVVARPPTASAESVELVAAILIFSRIIVFLRNAGAIGQTEAADGPAAAVA